MTMTAVLIPEQEIPDSGAFNLTMQIAGEVGISADEARKSVNRYVHRHLSYLFQADTPHLTVLDGMVCWQLPLVLTYPSYGVVGEVGQINVDIGTGELLVDDEQVAVILEQADALADRTAYQTTPTS